MLGILLFVTGLYAVRGDDLTVVVSAPTNAVVSGGHFRFCVNVLNAAAQPVAWKFPLEIPCRVQAQEGSADIWAHPDAGDATNAIRLASGTFARREYILKLPDAWVGEMMVKFGGLTPVQLAVNVENPPTTVPAAPAGQSWPMRMLKGSPLEAGEKMDPQTFFKQHIFGYEPMYFIAGTRSPNAKFQISFKYRVFNEEGEPAHSAPWLTGFHVAYTQMSLWDWNGASAPFYDTSYMPELLYSWDHLECSVGGNLTNWFRFDFEGGLHHESNGKAGADSRSMNLAYLRPTCVFGADDGLQLKLIPRVWTYLGDLSDNPDIAEYRGYVDLRAVAGWQRGLQVSALARMGRQGDHAGYQFDVTWPLMQPPLRSFSVYLQLQYFTGYGESLLGYNRKSDEFRAGFSIYR